jgi:hypothetical protein
MRKDPTVAPRKLTTSPYAQILIVEHDVSHLQLVLRAFSECGITKGVAIARDAAEARDFILSEDANAEQLQQSRLVVLDLELLKVGKSFGASKPNRAHACSP